MLFFSGRSHTCCVHSASLDLPALTVVMIGLLNVRCRAAFDNGTIDSIDFRFPRLFCLDLPRLHVWVAHSSHVCWDKTWEKKLCQVEGMKHPKGSYLMVVVEAS